MNVNESRSMASRKSTLTLVAREASVRDAGMASLAWRKRSPIEVWDMGGGDGEGSGWGRVGSEGRGGWRVQGGESACRRKGERGPESLAYRDYRFVATSL